MKILALYSIKGGVGKTAAAVNLAHLAARDGIPTLIVDLDPQASTSFYFRVRPKKKFRTRTLLAGGEDLESGIRATDYEGLDVLPAHLSYRRLDLALDAKKRSKSRLSEILEPLAGEYDLAVLDCPPNITLLSENVFRTADLLLVPVIPTVLSLRTFDTLLEFFLDKDLERSRLAGFFSMVEQRKRIHRDIMEDLEGSRRPMLNARIPYRSEVEQMGIHREPVICFRPGSAAVAAYRELWGETRALLWPE